jgi:hypothetical protein
MSEHEGSIRTSMKYAVRSRIFQPPFLPANEIRRRRFSEIRIRRKGKLIVQKVFNVDMNDDWWKWEDELGLTAVEPFRPPID